LKYIYSLYQGLLQPPPILAPEPKTFQSNLWLRIAQSEQQIFIQQARSTHSETKIDSVHVVVIPTILIERDEQPSHNPHLPGSPCRPVAPPSPVAILGTTRPGTAQYRSVILLTKTNSAVHLTRHTWSSSAAPQQVSADPGNQPYRHPRPPVVQLANQAFTIQTHAE
jgi:hypothetical protein